LPPSHPQTAKVSFYTLATLYDLWKRSSGRLATEASFVKSNRFSNNQTCWLSSIDYTLCDG
jgi:hypothetical protein